VVSARQLNGTTRCSDAFAGFTLLIILLLGGCSWGPPVTAGADDPRRRVSGETTSAVRSEAASTASQMVGVPYLYGGQTPDGFDCSGLVHYAYHLAGQTVPRTSRGQLDATRPIGLEEAQPGDLLFFRKRRAVSHVGVYLGDDRFVHAPSTGQQVTIETLTDPYYQSHFVRAGRF
jgi:cell wall-associated NlpC family hydrolase